MLRTLLYPKSVAVIGVSSNSKKIGHTIAKNILSHKFSGKVYLVNPSSKKILGKKVFSSVIDIPAKVDLAVISIPAAFTPRALEECGKKKIPYSIIISAGFSETGEEGRRLEEEILRISKKYSIGVLGPNCLGILNSENRLNASFARGMIRPGGIGFISQSGAICSAMLDWSHKNNLGFSKFISLGNTTALDEVDFMKYFENDPKTSVVLCYLEEIRSGKEFLESARLLAMKKPLIILKAGVTDEGKKAALSHTGSLAGDDTVVEAAFQEANIIRVRTLEDFFNMATIASCANSLKGNKIAVISNAGGPAVLTTDLVSQSFLQFAELKQETQKKLSNNLPKTANIKNPIDIVGDANAFRYETTLSSALTDTGVDACIVILTPQTVTEIDATAKVIIAASKKYKKSVVATFIGGKKALSGVTLLAKKNIPVYEFPNQAVAALSALYKYVSNKNKQKSMGSEQYKKIVVNTKEYNNFKNIFILLATHTLFQMSLKNSLEILKAYELPCVESFFAESAQDVEKINFEYPLAAKIDSQDVVHKSDINAVVVNIKNKDEARVAFASIQKNVFSRMPQAKVAGVVFQPMAAGFEVICGARRDPQFGPVVLAGIGGIYAEVFNDVSLRLAPVSRSDARELLSELHSYPILKGIRGKPSCDMESLVDIINKLSQIMIDFPEIMEIDLNPVMVGEAREGARIVDFRIVF